MEPFEKNKPTWYDYLKSNLLHQMGIHQPNVEGKRLYLTTFRREIADHLRKGEISEAQKVELEQMANEEQKRLDQELLEKEKSNTP